MIKIIRGGKNKKISMSYVHPFSTPLTPSNGGAGADPS